MKKILLTSTALIATASVAAAEVKFEGYGRFGLGYVEDRGDTADDVILVSRFRLNIDAKTETDTGVEFSARVRLQADEDADTGEQKAAGLNGARFSVIYGGLRVDAGNVGGAIDNLDNYYGTEPGLETFLGQYSGVDYDFLGYSSDGAGSNAVFFQYKIGGGAVSASYDQGDRDRWDISAAYTFNNVTAALAYGQTGAPTDGEKESLVVLTLGAEVGDVSGSLFIANDDVDKEESGVAYGLSGAYSLGAATTLQFAYGDGGAGARNIGVGAKYDLGGGASLLGGIGQIQSGDEDGQLRADLGAQFAF
ncbi:porin [uncultured Ruegeria sp.]|uniref:porin n=1 Tax=uncultured Ruegeria sp. TaxID=259304 RepID=UPI002603EAB8|nr:porin [uncultured Ruegeria sp.]